MNEPLMLTKDTDGEVSLPFECLYTSGKSALLIKPVARQPIYVVSTMEDYLNLSGKFISMPEFKEVENFPCEAG